MKRRQLLRHLREHHCVADEKGRNSTTYRNALTGAIAIVANDPDPDDWLIRTICRRLEIALPRSISALPATARARAAKRSRRG